MSVKPSQPLVSFVIPCGKEPRRIVSALLELDAYASTHSFTYELLVTLYTSDIHTRDVVHRMESLIPHMRILEIKGRVGSAIQKGMLDARGLMRIFVTPLLAQHIQLYPVTEGFFRKGYDVVVGSYYVPGSSSVSFIPDRVYQWAIGKLLRFSSHDTGAGWVAYSQKAAVRIFPHTTAHSDVIVGESLARAHQEGMRIKELPIAASIRPRVSGWSYVRKFFESLRISVHFLISSSSRNKRV